ncbi:MAG: hypothetical protein DHS20C16_06360 [Phycisphaerae bacterium]|nr:MAG: hypothetical protein DHS20C16_06360 [Phycisphaerae bacterium]
MNRHQQFAVAILAVAISVGSGCGPGYRDNTASFKRCHESVKWIYHTGWQNVYFQGDFIPFVLPFTNTIRDLEFADDHVIVHEHANGDFGQGRYFPRAELDIESGRLLSYEYLDAQKFVETVNMKVECKQDGVELANGWWVTWKADKTFRVYVSRHKETDKRIMILERPGFGLAGGWIPVPDRNAILLVVAGRKAIGLWEAETYLLYVDFDRIENATPAAIGPSSQSEGVDSV